MVRFLLCLLSLLVCGCTTVPPPSDCCVSGMVDERIGHEVYWGQDETLQCLVAELLQQNLTLHSAVEIALLNNPEIQALFEDIGIAQADLVEAGLISNPLFFASVRFPDPSSLAVNTEFSITQSFIDILLVPLRQKVAAAELAQTELRVANAILDLSFDVQQTYYALTAEQSKLLAMQPLIEAAEVTTQLAQAQRQQGNINELELQDRLTTYLEVKMELSRSQLEVIRLREKMNQLLGLDSIDTCWTINSALPALPETEICLKSLEEIALAQRLDLDMARWEVEKLARTGATKDWWAYTQGVLGISTEKDPEGFTVTGPTLSGAIPIFNYGQADRARLGAMYRQSLDRFQALEIRVLSEIRAARERLQILRDLALAYQEELLPLQKQIVSTSQKFYNVMGLNVYKLLNAKSRQLRLEIDYLITQRDYWLARVELNRALGGELK